MEPMRVLFTFGTFEIFVQLSGFFKWLELLLTAQAWDNEAPVVLLSREAGVNKLFKQAYSSVTSLPILLHQLDLLLKHIVLSKLRGVLLFLKESSLLLYLDLLLRSSPLTLLLQQAGRYTLVRYIRVDRLVLFG